MSDADRRMLNAGGRSPIWATFAITWINNLGAATALIAVYFIAKSRFGFSATESLLLGLLQGVTYIAGAMTAGMGSRLFSGPGRAMSTRSLLMLIQLALFALCLLPIVAKERWAIWVLVGVYSPVTGWLWPVIESFFSAGRSGESLRKASSAFNLSWASSQVLTFWAISPFMKSDPPASPDQPLWLIAAMGVSHLVCVPLTLALPREPGSHAHGDDPQLSRELVERFRMLLVCFRTMLVMSYIVYSALNPLLPTRMVELGIVEGSAANALLTSVWMASRVCMFFAMGAWGGWHGKRSALAWSGVLLMLGFAVCMLAPSAAVMALGMVLFGLGMGAIYSGAFYYAMEVGSAAVDAGGKHEALIGLGYTAGPIAGVGAATLASAGVLASLPFEWITSLTTQGQINLGTLLLVMAMSVIAAVIVWRRAGSTSRREAAMREEH